jgi:hypothetical protein
MALELGVRWPRHEAAHSPSLVPILRIHGAYLHFRICHHGVNRDNCTFTLSFFIILIYILGGKINLSQEFGVFSSSSELVAAEFTNNASSDGHYEDTAVPGYADGSVKFCLGHIMSQGVRLRACSNRGGGENVCTKWTV